MENSNRCYNCCMLDHDASQCTNKRVELLTTLTPNTIVFCSNCRKVGHTLYHCKNTEYFLPKADKYCTFCHSINHAVENCNFKAYCTNGTNTKQVEEFKTSTLIMNNENPVIIKPIHYAHIAQPASQPANQPA